MRLKIILLALLALFVCGNARAQGGAPCTLSNNLSFQIPNIGNISNWGDCLDYDIGILDNILGGYSVFPAGQTTPTVASFSNWMLVNTSTTTITNFLGGFSGQTIKIICAPQDIYTMIASGANISVSGAWSCSSSTSITLTQINGKWYENGRGGGPGGSGGLIDPGANGLVKRTALNVTQIAVAGTDFVAPSTTINGHALTSNVTVSASDLTTGTLPHAQLPTLLSADIPNNSANTLGSAASLSGSLTQCPSGQAATGIVATGSAAGCAPFVSSTGTTNGTPAFFLASQQLSSHAIYFYAESFGNSDPGANIIACLLKAAIFNGICDSTYYSGKWTMAEGDHFKCADPNTPTPMTWIVPMDSEWDMSAPDNPSGPPVNMLDAYPLCTIVGFGGVNNLLLTNTSENVTAAGFNSGIVIHPNASSNGRVSISGIGVQQHGAIVGGSETQYFGSHVAYSVLSMVDNSILWTPTCFDSSSTDLYCFQFRATNSLGYSATVYNLQADVNSKGQVPLEFDGNGTAVGLSGLNLIGGSPGHPGIGFPNFLCQDFSSQKLLDINVTGDMYFEGNQTAVGGDLTSPVIKIDGCRHVNIDHIHAASFQTGRTSPGVVITNGYPTTFTMTSMSLIGFPGSTWIYPAVAVQNANSGNVMTDGQGQYGNYTTNAAYFQGVTSFRPGTSNTQACQYTLLTPTVNTCLEAVDNGSGTDITFLDANNVTAGQNFQFDVGRFTTLSAGGIVSLTIFKGDGSSTSNFQLNGSGPSVAATETGASLNVGFSGTGCNSTYSAVFCEGTNYQFRLDASGNETLDHGASLTLNGSASGGASLVASPTGGALDINTNFVVASTGGATAPKFNDTSLTPSSFVCSDGSKNLSSTCPTTFPTRVATVATSTTLTGTVSGVFLYTNPSGSAIQQYALHGNLWVETTSATAGQTVGCTYTTNNGTSSETNTLFSAISLTSDTATAFASSVVLGPSQQISYTCTFSGVVGNPVVGLALSLDREQ